MVHLVGVVGVGGVAGAYGVGQVLGGGGGDMINCLAIATRGGARASGCLRPGVV